MSQEPATSKAKGENPLINLLFNIVLPSLILTKLSSPDRLGPLYALLLGVSFPLVYGLYDIATSRKVSPFSVLGFVSILLTGGLGLYEVGKWGFAVKEASIPSIIGLVALYSLKTSKPLVRMMLYNETVMNIGKVDDALLQRGSKSQFEDLLRHTTAILALSFFMSAGLNFGLAVYLLEGQPGSEEFTKAIGTMTAMSYPVIVLPCMIVTGYALYKLMTGIKLLTGLSMEDVMHR